MVMLETNCSWQALMNTAYDRWQKHDEEARVSTVWDNLAPWGFKDMLTLCSEAERAACILGKLNQQVENGGFHQWVSNDYALDSRDWLADLLSKMGPVSLKVLEMVRIITDFDIESEHLCDDDDGWRDAMDASDRLSDQFYALQDEWHPEVYAVLELLSSP